MRTIPKSPIKRLRQGFRALETQWLERTNPLELARRQHREAKHARDRKFLTQYIRPGGVGVEVGVFWAHFSEVLVSHFKPSKLYLVDPWDRLHGETFNFSTPYTLGGTLRTDTAEKRAQALASRHPDVIEVRKQYSTEFFPTIPDGSLDWVYLDATHHYPEVLADLRCIWPKLKSDGVLIGDDYFVEEDAKHIGTRWAVDEFAAENGIDLIKERHYQYILPRPDAQLTQKDPDHAS